MNTTQPQAQPETAARPDRDDRADAPAVAFLGTGRMGAPMAANLARGGFHVRVWNRTAAHAEPLAAEGAVVAASPAVAARGATIVITMLADGAATEQAATGPDGLLAAGPGLIWVQMGTVGVEWTTRLADLTELTAETLSFARRLGLDPAEVVDLLQSNPLGAPYAVQKARSMLAGDFSPAFALKHALKDAELAAQAARASGAALTLTSALLPRWRDTAAGGHADDDVAAVYLTT